MERGWTAFPKGPLACASSPWPTQTRGPPVRKRSWNEQPQPVPAWTSFGEPQSCCRREPSICLATLGELCLATQKKSRIFLPVMRGSEAVREGFWEKVADKAQGLRPIHHP